MVISLKQNLDIPYTLINMEYKCSQTLKEAYQTLGGDPPSKIPFLIWLLENPKSPLRLPGNIDLYRHDCLHILLNRSFSLDDEAFVVGFTIGNDVKTKKIHLMIFKIISTLFYPKQYRFNQKNYVFFEAGLILGKKISTKNLNRFDFTSYENLPISAIRQKLGISKLEENNFD